MDDRQMIEDEKDRKIAGDLGEQLAHILWLAVHDNEDNCTSAGRRFGEMIFDADNAPLA